MFDFTGHKSLTFYSSLTHVGDPNGHPLVEEVEDHDYDKVDAGGGDGGGQLWSDQVPHQLDIPGGAVLHDAGEGREHGQPVGYHPDDTGHDQGHLWRTRTHTVCQHVRWGTRKTIVEL